MKHQLPNGHPHPHPHPLAGIRRPQRVSGRTDTRPLKGRRGGWKDFLPAVEYLDSWKEILPVDEVHVPCRPEGFPSSRPARYMYPAGWKGFLPVDVDRNIRNGYPETSSILGLNLMKSLALIKKFLILSAASTYWSPNTKVTHQ
ncbi:hypothetical protein PGT21_014102 [Puccinia graminis f. sp. tritici]|uniref:Uncharacterized protein n=1 Tax=Puccinia graminis f. sp. tritici TaxID=56615 RepID=A0A5B0Q5J6_PUCGR|nr:hypothetical protein PGT21_014102 [Puccinia graminis f. sp. tritici]